MRESLRRMRAISRKEYLHLLRDKRTLFAVLGMPILQLLLFAYAISFDVNDVPTILLDGDRTTASRQYLASYEESDFFDVVAHVDSMDEIDEAFDASLSRAAVIVAPGFERAIAAGQEGQVSVLLDGSEPNSAQLGQTYAIALNEQLGREITMRWANAQGYDVEAFGGINPLTRTWYNPEGRSSDYLIPGLIVAIIMIVTIQQTAVTLVKEKEQGTFEQIIISPVRRGELMIGKVAPWVLLAFADMIAITLVAMVVFQTPLRGDVLTLAVGTFWFVLCCLAIGLIISAISSSVEVANIIGLLISFLPAFMLSGFAFPLNGIPPFLKFVSYLFPGRYMVTLTRSVFLKGGGFDILWPQITALAVYAVVALTLATLLYSRRST